MNLLLGCGMIVLCLSLQILVVSYLLRGLSIWEKKHLLRFSTLSPLSSSLGMRRHCIWVKAIATNRAGNQARRNSLFM